jgi:large subunit ribosomal protein L3
MGHRKKNAPRRGSLAYRPRGRAHGILPRIRTWPKIISEKPVFLGFVGFKVGLIHVITVDDREKTPNYGKPVFNTATVISTPPIYVIGVRVYGKNTNGLFPLKDFYLKSPKEMKDEKAPKTIDESFKVFEDISDRIHEISAIVQITPKSSGLSQKKTYIFEIGVVSVNSKSCIEYLKTIIGKEVKIDEVIKPGSYIDIVGITKGKGFEGPITRFGVKRKQHKSRKSVRALATLGPWKPASVMYTVPRAGQRGYHQRIEYNKKVIALSNTKDSDINPKSGFPHFGIFKDDYIILKGSIPGPSKRIVKIRLPIRPPRGKIQPPKILEISTVPTIGEKI